jgi:hypothetical protein
MDSASHPPPFGLSLSKPCPLTTAAVRPEVSKGPGRPDEGFDKLSPSGSLAYAP